MENNNEGLTKKERVEQKRIKRENEEKKIRQARATKRVMKWILGIIIIGGLLYWAATSIVKSNEARLGEQVSIEGRDHVDLSDNHRETYNTNPPTSGPHGGPLNFGVYAEEISDENVVHNLEHGGIWISYTGLDDEAVLQLEKIARARPNGVILSPRSANDTSIAVVSWGRLMKLDVLDVELIEKYIRQNINKSPEPLAF